MNKKYIIGMVVVLILIITLGVGISLKNNGSKTNNGINDSDTQIENNGNSSTLEDNNNGNTSLDDKTLVIYFSATGTTKRVASSLSTKLNSALIEIIPKDKYSSSDLNYNDTSSRVVREHEDTSSRPEIENTIDIDKYSTIYLGYPIWWNDAPRIIYTFLDEYDLSTKNLYLFSTSASSGIEGSANNIKKYRNLNVLGSRRFSSSFKDKDIEDFIKNK